MSRNKAIKSGKEHRKSYCGAKTVDKQCRNHESCPRSYNNRVVKDRKYLMAYRKK